MARMRLTSRPSRSLGDSWVQPRATGRWTTLGNLDSPARAFVDPAGLVTLAGSTWSLDWWIGADDRWHLPCQEVAVRQSLISGSPVVETRLRVPSGDAVHRAYAARSIDGSEAIVIEIENASTIPFAVALAVRPHGQAEVGRIDSIELSGTTLRVDGRMAVVLPKSPGRYALSDAASGDSAAVVFSGGALAVASASVSCSDGLAQGALLFPLAHTAVLRVVMPLDGAADGVEPAEYPSAAQVASGWSTHASGGMRVELPDRRLRDAVVASTRHLLLGQDGPDVIAAIDLMGFPREADRLLRDTLSLARTDAPGATLYAVVRHWELTRDLVYARSAVDVLGALIARLGRAGDDDSKRGRSAFPAAARLLEALGEQRAAADVRRIVVADDDPGPANPLSALLGTAGSTWTWAGRDVVDEIGSYVGHDLAMNARLVSLVRDRLVREDDEALLMSPTVDESWLGQGWELHDAPTRHGRLSFAVRWHGDRPALLWELSPHEGDPPTTLRIPGLDPTWSTTDTVGEALLAPVAIPDKGPRRGLTIPVSIESVPRRQP